LKTGQASQAGMELLDLMSHFSEKRLRNAMASKLRKEEIFNFIEDGNGDIINNVKRLTVSIYKIYLRVLFGSIGC
jgi:hypothetical protein